MGTVPLIEAIHLTVGGRRLVLSADTTTSDLSMKEEGCAGVYGEFEDGAKAFGFSMPLSMHTDRWVERFCDALSFDKGFLDGLSSLPEIDRSFIVPASPSRKSGMIASLIRNGKKAKFGDFANLKSGRDAWSSMKLAALVDAVGHADADEVHKLLSDLNEEKRSVEVTKALRWVLRGLPIALAVRKVRVDLEVAANADKKRR